MLHDAAPTLLGAQAESADDAHVEEGLQDCQMVQQVWASLRVPAAHVLGEGFVILARRHVNLLDLLHLILIAPDMGDGRADVAGSDRSQRRGSDINRTR